MILRPVGLEACFILADLHDRAFDRPWDALDLGSAAARLAELHGGQAVTLVGSGAPLLAETFSGATVLTPVSPDPVAVARLAAAKPAPSHSPRPLYLRAPYATLPAA